MNDIARDPDYRSLMTDALLKLREVRGKLAAVESERTEAIAIIGASCRFPGADNPEALWKLLAGGTDAIGVVPPDRWDVERLYDPNPDALGKIYTREGGFLKEKDAFDPLFFGISPREAAHMDPQQRLLLEVAWEALENACLSPSRLYGSRTGAFIGISTMDYLTLIAAQLPNEELAASTGTGIAHSPASGRLSYLLGFTGPSFVVDTACSSSLVAVHLACESLRRRECHLALAGGVNMIVSPLTHIIFSRARMLSPDGRCKSFDAAADGYGRGEGAGVVVLKRLSDAVKDGDSILALIRGSSVNQDGASGGLTVPNGPAQQAVIRQALEAAGANPAEIGYVEAHGTGTALGDPIEVQALGAVFSDGHDRDNPLWVGSVKSNLGHLEAAAGSAGLIKLVLQLQHEEIAPSLHFRNPSPHIPWDKLPIEVATQRIPWPRGARRRIAGVSSFGFSGTNAHVVVEEAPPVERKIVQVERPLHVLALSARSEEALAQLVSTYCSHLTEQPDLAAADVCFSAGTGRSHFENRLSVVAASREELCEKLEGVLSGQTQKGVHKGAALAGAVPKIAFLFTGQGSQYAGMAKSLYETQPLFRERIDRCGELLRQHLEEPLPSLLWGESSGHLAQTGYTQPVLFALEYALAELWRAWGIEPSLVMGHSVGEYAAACAAGVFGLEDGLKLIAARGRLMQALPRGGAMLAVLAGEERVRALAAAHADKIAVAAFNGPLQTVLSGDAKILSQVAQSLKSEGVDSRALEVSHAFHSPLMEPMLEAFAEVARSVAYRSPDLRLVSNVTGGVIGKEIASADYWVRHVRAPVRFLAGMETAAALGCNVFLEIGPKPVLLGMGRQCVQLADALWLPSLGQGESDWSQILESVAALYARGVDMDWVAFDRDYVRRKVALPTYPFQRAKYWLFGGPGQAVKRARPAAQGHPLLGQRLHSAGFNREDVVFESILGGGAADYIEHHRVYDTVIFPAAGYVEMALAAGARVLGTSPLTLADVTVQEPLVLPPEREKTLQTVLTREESGRYRFKIYSQDADDEADRKWILHAGGEIGPATPDRPAAVDPARLASAGAQEVDVEEHYRQYHELGLQYGAHFRGMHKLWRDGRAVFGSIRLPEALASGRGEYRIHPVLLDSAFQALGAALDTSHDKIYLPMGIDAVTLHQPAASGSLRVEVALRDSKDEGRAMLVADMRLYGEDGAPVATVAGLKLLAATRAAVLRSLRRPLEDRLYQAAWLKRPLPPTSGADSTEAAGTWLLFADRGGFAQRLAAAARSRGVDVVRVCAAPGSGAVRRLSPDEYEIDPADAGSYRDLLREVAQARGNGTAWPPRHVVYLWNLDLRKLGAGAADDGAMEPLRESHLLGCGGALHAVQALAGAGWTEPPRLWLLTRGGQAIERSAGEVDSRQSALWGLGRVVALEHPPFNCSLVDLGVVPSAADEAVGLVGELLAADRENNIAYRGGERYVARLERMRAPARASAPKAEDQPFEIKISTYGALENLARVPLARRAPGPGEVEVEVRATGVNFKDVLHALGLLKKHHEDNGLPWSEDTPFGFECSGVVSVVGEGAGELRVGDAVIVQAMGCLRSHVTVDKDSVIPMPKGINFEEAAAIPTVFLTSYYSLHVLARIKPGDRILIHAAAGGVGQAAIQLAQRAGAEVYATASPSKWEFLKSQGVQHVMNSRTLEYAEQIMALTEGRGVDVILNSLTGEFIEKNFQVLARGGRYIEIGKLGIWDRAKVESVRPDADYHAFDLAEMSADASSGFREIGLKVAEGLAEGSLRPLPVKTFQLQQVADAFRYLAQAKNIGKVVVSMPRPAPVRDRGASPAGASPIRGDASYLITGGLGAIGLQSAEWLVREGARFLVLSGRRAPSQGAQETIGRLEQLGARVLVVQGDIADRGDAVRLFETIEAEAPPLAGIIHAAGVLDDGVLLQQTWQRFEATMAPKVTGTWNLHALSRRGNRGVPLDFFVCLSSIASLLGSPGQGNYAAANAYMDGLMAERHAQGLPGLSINWGPWADSGMAADAAQRNERRFAAIGLGSIAGEEGFRIFGALLERDLAQAAVMDVTWSKFLAQFFGAEPPLLEVFKSSSAPARTHAKPAVLKELAHLSKADGTAAMMNYLREELGRVLGFSSPEKIEPRRKLLDMGIDSLMAVELKTRLEASLGRVLPVTLMFDYPTLEVLSVYLYEQVAGSGAPGDAKDGDAKGDDSKDPAENARRATSPVNPVEEAAVPSA